MGAERTLKPLLSQLEKQGATIVKSTHLKIYHPNGKLVVVSVTPKHSALFKVRADLRRIGFEV